MKVVYIAHPLGAGPNREANRQAASRWVAWAAKQGVAPVADWIILSGQWGEEERELGLRIDVELVKRCDELWLTGPRISPGMRIEATAALETKRLKVRDLTGMAQQFGGKPPANDLIYAHEQFPLVDSHMRLASLAGDTL